MLSGIKDRTRTFDEDCSFAGGLSHSCISVLSFMSGFHGNRELNGRQALPRIFKGKQSSLVREKVAYSTVYSGEWILF